MDKKGQYGPKPGSSGAGRIAEAHRGSQPHDKKGGFASNRQRARELGQKGGNTVKKKYGENYYHRLGLLGGRAVLITYGKEHFRRIGRLGGARRAQVIREKKSRGS